MASATIISDDIAFITEVWDNMHNWLEDENKRNTAIKMLNEFDAMVADAYWLTDAEEAFLAEIAHTIESYC